MSLLDDIGDHLTTEGLVGGATGWELAKGWEPPTPDQVVTLYQTAGGEPDQTDGTKYDLPAFQVRVRGDQFGYEAAEAKIQAVFTTLNDATVSGYVYIFAVQSGPLPLGHDGNTRPLLTWNFTTMKQRA